MKNLFDCIVANVAKILEAMNSAVNEITIAETPSDIEVGYDIIDKIDDIINAMMEKKVNLQTAIGLREDYIEKKKEYNVLLNAYNEAKKSDIHIAAEIELRNKERAEKRVPLLEKQAQMAADIRTNPLDTSKIMGYAPQIKKVEKAIAEIGEDEIFVAEAPSAWENLTSFAKENGFAVTGEVISEKKAERKQSSASTLKFFRAKNSMAVAVMWKNDGSIFCEKKATVGDMKIAFAPKVSNIVYQAQDGDELCALLASGKQDALIATTIINHKTFDGEEISTEKLLSCVKEAEKLRSETPTVKETKTTSPTPSINQQCLVVKIVNKDGVYKALSMSGEKEYAFADDKAYPFDMHRARGLGKTVIDTVKKVYNAIITDGVVTDLDTANPIAASAFEKKAEETAPAAAK